MPVLAPTHKSTYEQLCEKLNGVVPEIELRYKAELVHEINQKKLDCNTVILGHNYMEPALYHGVADFVGDSLELCRKAAQVPEETIVFCGVRFMAETAKVLNPEKTVLLPSLEAGCSLAASITAEDVRELRARFPNIPVVTYINTYAEVKAECDACCTSSNAAAVIESFDEDTVIFLPDEYLARNVARETGRHFVSAGDSDTQAIVSSLGVHSPTIIGWSGKCEVHEQFSVEDVSAVRKQFPDVVVLAHPECSPEVLEASDFSGSTSGMSRFVRDSDSRRFLLLTECAMGDNVAAENPRKEMVRLCSVRCPHMNEITLEQTLASLEYHRHVIEVSPQTAENARRAVERMLATVS